MTPTEMLVPDLIEAALPDVEDAVIREARRRARRRRRAYAGAAVIVAIAGVAVASTMGGTPSPVGPTPPGVVAPSPLAATGSPGAGLVAHWGVAHAGFALVYADGRVILNPDLHSSVDGADPHLDPYWQRRLTAEGLARVRSGAITLNTFLDGTELPVGTWADAVPTPYGTPLGYAVCGAYVPGHPGNISAAELPARLPAKAGALLRGTERKYLSLPWQDMVMGGRPFPPHPEPTGFFAGSQPSNDDCFELTVAQARTLNRIIKQRGAMVDLHIEPALPGRVIVLNDAG